MTDQLTPMEQGLHSLSTADLIGRITTLIAWHRQDMAHVSEQMAEEADRRDWCSDYETFVRNTSRNLHVPMQGRYNTYDVTAVFKITFSTQVQARDDDDADTRSGFNDWDEEQIARQLRDGSADWSLEEVEAELAE